MEGLGGLQQAVQPDRPLVDAARPAIKENSRSSTDVQDGKVRIVVTALDKDDEFLNFLDMSASVAGPDMKPIDTKIRQVAPGRYVGEFDAKDAGSYLLDAYARRRDGANLERRERPLLARVSRSRAERGFSQDAGQSHAARRAARHRDSETKAHRPDHGQRDRAEMAGIQHLPPRFARGDQLAAGLAFGGAGWRPACSSPTCSSAEFM